MYRRFYVAVVYTLILFMLVGCAPDSVYAPPEDVLENVFGDIIIDKENAEIRFSAIVAKNEGWVQHLIYLHGYQWLRQESAIISVAELSDLQKAFALLDWRLWDNLWQDIDFEQAYAVRVYIYHDGRKLPAATPVQAEDSLHVGELIFLGCPYFDPVALNTPPGVDCTLCPVFSLEQKAFRERFTRETGESGYELNTAAMPLIGSEVEVVIILPTSH